jgi:CubicO group peptidase (beta-lactamase class C family)
MQRSKNSYIATIFFTLIVFACHSKTDPANARTNPTGFHDTARKFGSTSLVYADTNSAMNRQIINSLDSFYRIQARAGFNGSVLVGYKGQVLYERYYGYANRERSIPLGPESSTQLASISKTFTGAAVLYLYEHKYIDLNAPVTKYIPEFPYANITVKCLLNHRSGLPDYTKWVPEYREDMKTPISNAHMLDMMVRHVPRLEFRPNTRFRYSNTNFAILAILIERVTNMKYPDFMQKYIFQPLGMNNTFVYNPWTGLPANATIDYKYNWRREPDMFADGVYGDKNIYSTVEDMYRWDQSFYKDQLLSNETIELAYGPCSFEKRGIKNYGLGWRMLCYPDGNKIIYHNGWWHGNNTSFYRFIKDNFTIIVLGNKHNNNIYHQAPVIFSIVQHKSAENGFDEEE